MASPQPQGFSSPDGADVIVVGAGVVGSAIALRLAQAGADVLVLERGEPGQEASWAAGGILGAQMEAHGTGAMLELSLASRQLHAGLAEELRSLTGIDVRYRPCGVLEVALDEEEEKTLLGAQAWQHAAGLRASLVLAQQLAQRKGLAPGRLGLWLPDDAQVDNQLLASALHAAAVRAGARFRQGSAVRRLLAGNGLEPRCTGVELFDGAAYAQTTVLAAGAWSSAIEGVPIPSGAVVPVRGQMVALLPRGPLFPEVIGGGGVYLIPRVDGRLLVGATVERVGFHKQVTASGLSWLLERAQALWPGLADAKVLEHWSGLRPGSADGLPLLGQSALDGLLFATGHYRNGVLLAPITAQLIADLAQGKKPAIDLGPFRVDRFGI